MGFHGFQLHIGLGLCYHVMMLLFEMSSWVFSSWILPKYEKTQRKGKRKRASWIKEIEVGLYASLALLLFPPPFVRSTYQRLHY